jgi:integration host factor subunit beta
MLKSELVRKVAEHCPELYLRDAEYVVDAILGEIVQALRRGDRVEIRGFGIFSANIREAHVGRNPKNGVKVQVTEKAVLVFKAGREMRRRINKPNGGAV